MPSQVWLQVLASGTHISCFIKHMFYIQHDICKRSVLIYLFLLLLSGGGEQGDLKQKDKKFITKEQEPEQ